MGVCGACFVSCLCCLLVVCGLVLFADLLFVYGWLLFVFVLCSCFIVVVH